MRRRLALSAAGGAVVLAFLLLGLDRLFPVPLDRYRALSLEVRDAGGALLDLTTARDGMYRLAATPETVGDPYLGLLLATEDRRFYWHPGVDPLALGRALWQLATHGHVVSGGSTLTMQVARLLTPHRHSYLGKLFDIARALQLEAHYSKTEILGMYLTLAPFGGNVEGVRAASEIWFGKEPSKLSEAEAALLVALPRAPERLRPDRHPDRALALTRRVLDRNALGEAMDGFAAPAWHRPPQLARHLTDRLMLAGETGTVRTLLQAPVQKALTELAQREKPWIGKEASIAALVVRNRDRAVLAYLGGTDYFGPGGMVDMVRASRSPGSTLKPFIYGLAFDDTLVLPDTLIDDVPSRIGDYAPRNFDRSFHGTVTAREALQQSYNLPAVALLDGVGPARFAAALRLAGARLKLPAGGQPASLPIALGGVGISLQDLAMLYTSLPDGGAAAPLRLLARQPPAATHPLMGARAAAQVGDILRGTPVPDGVSPFQSRAIAYKTGTSYGFRDAWAAGYSNAYTVVVWVGRVEGTPRPGAFGRNTAAPLLYKIFDLLPAEPAGAPAIPRPATVQAAEAKQPGSAPLAPGLHRFGGDAPGALVPHILFPPAGTVLDAGFETHTASPPVALEAMGGQPPYRWAVDGLPLPPVPLGLNASWRPEGPGFVRLSVTDRSGRSSSIQLRVR